MKEVSVGIIGGGLMGREMASAFARWCALVDFPVKPRLTYVADLSPGVLEWFTQNVDGVTVTTDYKELLADPKVDVVYVAVPHHLHEGIYLDVIAAGKDLFAEKPFGIDLGAAERIAAAAEAGTSFVRCSSEFPFLPGAQRAFKEVKSGRLGRIMEVVSGFHHSSDLDPAKAANWKRRSESCGEIGVMGDLGMHACHLPLRLGWVPERVYAQLQKGYPTRPDGRGGVAECDTWDNAQVHGWVDSGGEAVPLRLEMRRLQPGATNTWFFEARGLNGGVRFSTAEPKSLWIFERNGEQAWKRIDLGFEMEFKTITGGIFEPGFPDVIQQMWAAFFSEREGVLGDRFGCATPREAVDSQKIFAAALRSHAEQAVSAV